MIFTQSSTIEITFLSKDTIGIIATRVYQVDHGRCITIYFFVLWVNLLVLWLMSCFVVVTLLLGTDHVLLEKVGLGFFKEEYPKLFEILFISKMFPRTLLFPSLPERTKITPFKYKKKKILWSNCCCKIWMLLSYIRVITKLPNSEQSYKGKVKTHKYINRQNQSTTGKLWKP